MTTPTSLRMPRQAPGVIRGGAAASLRAGNGIAPAGVLHVLGSLVGLGDEGQAADDAIEAAAHLIPGAGGVYDTLSPLWHTFEEHVLTE
jgi:hypothetical protein